MKSRTSFCNKTVLKKDITRFAPAWLLYGLALAILGIIAGSRNMFTYYREYSVAYQLAGTQGTMLIFNFLFALLNAQLLFGDLFNTKLTNALHAMPIRRETWFSTHVISGILFHLVPSLILTVVFTFLCGELWLTAWCWFATVMLQYLFFFGLAVFACMCVGSRFAQGVVYSLCNFGAWLVYWTVDTVYIPLIPGINITFELLSPFCPIIYSRTNTPYNVVVARYQGMSDRIEWQRLDQSPDGWIYVLIIAAVGLALLFIARQLYRRRHLEVAGDFIAVSWLKPVFLLAYTLAMGIVCHYVLQQFRAVASAFLFIGLLVGFISGTMFLERTIKIFHKRTFLRLGICTAALALSMGLTVLDPLGIEYWVPDVDQIVSVTMYNPAGYAGANSEDSIDYSGLATTDPEDFGRTAQRITAIHRAALTDGTIPVESLGSNAQQPQFYDGYGYYYYGTGSAYNAEGYQITIAYTIRGGIYMTRTYGIPYDCPTSDLVADYMNEPEQVLRVADEKWETQLNRFWIPREGTYLYPTYDESKALMDAILADCAAGTMLQHDCFHQERGATLQVRFGDSHQGTAGQFQITVYPEAVNTRAWMEERGLYVLPEEYPPAEEAHFP